MIVPRLIIFQLVQDLSHKLSNDLFQQDHFGKIGLERLDWKDWIGKTSVEWVYNKRILLPKCNLTLLIDVPLR